LSASIVLFGTYLVKKKSKRTKETAATPEILTGWPAIAKYLGQPLSVAQRWAKSGMPVQRQGRAMTATPGELSRWLGRESGASHPVRIAQPTDDNLLEDLRRGLKQVRSQKK
jgi:hypothetical protein